MSDEPKGFASPACSAHEVDPDYMFAPEMPKDELVTLLNVLIESERAGAKTLLAWAREGAPGIDGAFLGEVQRDEARYVAGLTKAVRKLGAEPSGATGRFFDKAMTMKDWPARFAFLDKGQRWVADKVAEMLPRIRDPELREFLTEMHHGHEVNIARCADAAQKLGN
jgi:hypothetical protein